MGREEKKPVSSLGYRSNAAIPILSADKMRRFNAAFFLRLSIVSSKVENLAWHEIVKQAQAESWRAEKAARGRGSFTNRQDGCVQYAASVKAFLWFIRNGKRPPPVPYGNFFFIDRSSPRWWKRVR